MKIELKHGAGGKAMDTIIKDLILKTFNSSDEEVPLSELDDSAVINGIALTTDSYTVKPIFFPGGDIGKLAITGTVNDLSMIGATPMALSAGIVLEEGFEMEDFKRILASMGQTAMEAEVKVITGDLKVVEKGGLNGILINTSGIGMEDSNLKNNFEILKGYRTVKSKWLLDSNLVDGDVIIVSGYIGDHGVAILSSREGYGFESSVKSDAAPLNHMMHKVLENGGIVAAKDPTRGGLANTLNEWSEKSGVGMLVEEDKIPIQDGVKAACELLGIDPLQIGNEGKAVIAILPDYAESVLKVLHSTEEGKNAQIIGTAYKNMEYVVLETEVGGQRILEKPIGDPIPRIC